MRSLLVYALSCLLVSSAHSQIVNIPDLNFKNALLNHVPVINTNGDGEIQVSEAVAFTGTMNIYNKNISDLTGLFAFTNISGLLCGSNSLSTTFILTNFPSLQVVDCSGNFFPGIQLSNLPALSDFRIDNCNFFIQFPLTFSNLPSLKTISGIFSNISSVQLNNLNSLTSVDFKFSMAGSALSLNNLPSLTKVDCSWGNLVSISTTGSTALKELYCFMNPNLTSITLSNPGVLEKLRCDRSSLSNLPPGLTGLRVLGCADSKFVSLSLDNSNLLDTVNVSGNLLSSFSLTNKPNLRAFSCSYNQITNLNLSNLPKLSRLECYANQLTSLAISGYDSLSLINCGENQLTNLTLTNLPSLVQIYAAKNKITSLSISDFPKLLFLYCDQNLLSSLSLNKLPSLKHLICSDNRLTQLDLSGTAVENLACERNSNLSYINMKNNAITGSTTYPINVTGSTSLQSICTDDAESAYVISSVNSQLPGQNISVSSFCGFTSTGNYNTITGVILFDQTANGCNNQDSTMNYVKVDITDGIESGSTFTNHLGNYKFFAQRTPNTVTTTLPTNWFTVTPPLHTINFTGYGNTAIADFCVSSNGSHPDLDIVLLPIGGAQPGYNASYRLVYSNKGNQIQSGTISLSYDASKVNFVLATPGPSNQTAGNLTWIYSNLSPFQSRSIDVTFHVNPPPVVNGGDTLSFVSTINPVAGDETPADNVFSLNQVAMNSWDPNDKLVTEGSQVTIDKAQDFLHYLVRFQNTGTASAISVVIKDSLADNLDWNSFTPITASHPYRTVLTKGNKIEFIFDGINLPGKNMNEPASHGFVAFKIKPKSSITVGETIYNNAAIYFDYNLPIVTNTVSTTIISPAKAGDPIGLVISPNPVNNYLQFTVRPDIQVTSVNLYNSAGGKVYTEAFQNLTTGKKINISHLPNGILFLEVISLQGRSVQKVVKLR